MRRILLLSVCLVAGTVIVTFFWPSGAYEMGNVHPELRNLNAPYRAVSVSYFADGGSIGITIVDATEDTLLIALPVEYDYARLFVGAEHASAPGAIEVPLNEDTLRMLTSIIEDHRSMGGSSASALLALRGSFRDHASIICRAGLHFIDSKQ